MESFGTIVQKSWGYNEVSYLSDPRWQLLKGLYVMNYMHDLGRDYNTLPKKIHQIWLGSEFPEKYQAWADSWKVFNPDWEYKLWTDADIKDVDIPNKNIFNSITHLAQKSDFLRYHILNQYGGLYVDTDFECLKSFDDLTYANFITGVGYPAKVELYIGLIGSSPNHPILRNVIKSMSKKKMTHKHFTDIFNTTGTYFFTDIFFRTIRDFQKGIVVLPTDYFYPFPNHKGFEYEDGKKYIKDCSYAIHYWEVSWQKKKKNVS